VAERERVAFSELFDADMPRTRIVGILLAVLELVRRGRIRARQDRIFDEIWLETAPSASAYLSATPAAGPLQPDLPRETA
jgi:chromatin segregation and condensation protein Rec8/ScpA/Scc1 (kleisin family)